MYVPMYCVDFYIFLYFVNIYVPVYVCMCVHIHIYKRTHTYIHTKLHVMCVHVPSVILMIKHILKIHYVFLKRGVGKISPDAGKD